MPEKVEIDQLRKGDVVTFFYFSGHDPRPNILFLNFFNNLVHGLNLNYLSTGQTQYLKTILSNVAYSIYNIEDPKTFYENEIKKYGLGLAYRTYRPEKIVNLYKILYKFETIEKDLGLEREIEPQRRMEKPIKQRYTTKPEIPRLLPERIMPEHILPPRLLPDKIMPDSLLPPQILPDSLLPKK